MLGWRGGGEDDLVEDKGCEDAEVCDRPGLRSLRLGCEGCGDWW